MSVQLFIGFFSTGSAVISLAYSIFSWIQNLRRRNQMLAESRFEKIITSDDIHIISHYLFAEMGSIPISEYAKRDDVRLKVDMYIERVIAFTATPEIEVKEEPKEVKEPAEKVFKDSQLTVEVLKIQKEIDANEIWNALAQLRRGLEVRMRELAAKKEVDMPQKLSAGPMSQILLRHELIPKTTYMNLQYVIRICNDAIHGHIIPEKEVNKALQIAKPILEELSRK